MARHTVEVGDNCKLLFFYETNFLPLKGIIIVNIAEQELKQLYFVCNFIA